MKSTRLLQIFFLVVLSAAELLAQNNSSKTKATEKPVKNKAVMVDNASKLKVTAATGDSVIFRDGDGNTLIKITDEGTVGSITIPPGNAPSTTTNKLYDVGSTLYFNGSALGSGGGVSAINDLSDAKTDTTSIFLGNGSGVSDDSSNNNSAVGIYALHSNTSGHYNVANGYGSLYSNTTGSDNSAVGLDALYNNTTGFNNTANGYTALKNNTSGGGNIAIGIEALYSNTTGGDNTANGFQALYHNIAGSKAVAVGYQSQYYAYNTTFSFTNYNTSVGYESLRGSLTASNNTGNYNSAFGYQTLYSNTTGNANTANGSYTLNSNTTGEYNTANGYLALYSNTTGYDNTANGSEALYSNTTGSGNTTNGYLALYSNTTGTGNTAVGYSADVSSGSLTNATAIGYNAIVDASNKIRLGNSSVSVIEGQVPYTYTSDSTKKENFINVDGEKVLEKFRKFKLTSWNYKGNNPKTQRHYGIMAQVFYSAFGHDAMGKIGNDTTLNGGDVTGINMIAIQALEKRTTEQDKRIKLLEKLNAEIKMQDTEIKKQDSKLKNEFESIKLIVSKMAGKQAKINVTYK